MKEPNTKLMPNLISLILFTSLVACGLFYILEFIRRAEEVTKDELHDQASLVWIFVIIMHVALSHTVKEETRNIISTKNSTANINMLLTLAMLLVNGIVGSLWLYLRFPATTAHNFESYLILWAIVLGGALGTYLVSRKRIKGIV